MKKSHLLQFTGLSVLAVSCSAEKPRRTEKMNILYIMTDDHSYQTISAYDQRYIETPNIDRIAKEGVRFCNSFVGNSISGPSRAIMLTGKHSHANGFRNNSDRFDGGQQTYPKLLQNAGYETAIVGKWHLTSEPTGFNYWNILIGQGEYYNPTFINNGVKEQVKGYATTVTTDIAIDWLEEKRDRSKPFCLLLHHKAPHRTWMADTADLKLFEDREFPLPANFFDTYEGRRAASEQKMSIREDDMNLVYDLKLADKEQEIKTGNPGLDGAGRRMYDRMSPEEKKAWDAHYNPIIQDFKDKKLSGEALMNWKFQRYMRDYLKCIHSVDQNIGRVLKYLEENDLLENTLIVYTSDQGFYMGEHGWFDKRFMYEESFRTPLLMRLPGGKARGDINEMVQNIDYAPTILDLAGVEVPEDMHGESLLPLLEGENPEWRDALYYHYYEFPDEHAVKRHYGVRDERYKLIHFYDDIDEWEFYDLQQDPSEMHNAINDPAYKDEIERMRIRLHELQVQYNDPIRDREV